MVETVHEFTSCAVLEAADPAFFACPSDKRRTRETVAQMRLAEKRLDKFWATVDDHCEMHTSYSVHHLLMVGKEFLIVITVSVLICIEGFLQRLEPQDPQDQALG